MLFQGDLLLPSQNVVCVKQKVYVGLTHSLVLNFSSTRSCPQGRTTVITLHCDPDQKGRGTVQLPAKCPDGTCDGCNFNFMWASASACPICTESNYR